jgi:hypothetical protein
MEDKTIAMIVMACILGLVGIALMASQGMADWGLRTRRGQRWVRWFGERKASIILRFVAGPFILLMAAVGIWAAISGS